MDWTCEERIITDSMIETVEKKLQVKFPEDFLGIIKKYDGGYPEPDQITVNGREEAVNNLVSFLEEDPCYIIDIFEETEFFSEMNLIPVAEDGMGNLYCYDFADGKSKIVFWDAEIPTKKEFVCNTFTEFIEMLHEENEE